jgi:ABC-2 type transport system permease protein
MVEKTVNKTTTPASSRKKNSLVFLLGIFVILLLVNFIATKFYTRFDLTKEKRYSLVKPTKTLLRKLDDVVSVQIFLDKNVNAGVLRLRNSTEDIMNEFKAYGGSNFEFEFIDPLAGKSESQQIEIINEFKKKGILGTNLKVQSSEGFQQKYILPGAIVTYRSRQLPINLLENQLGYSPEDNLNNSVIGLEYKFSSAINKLQQHHKPRILFTQGHGELMPIEMLDLANSLEEAQYEVEEFDLSSSYRIPVDVACLIVAKPQTRFEEKDKYKIDQYIMNGGKVLWLRESVLADMDSLRNASQVFMALPVEDNLDDMFFTYGARINQDLVQDIQLCNPIPLVTGNLGGQPQTQLFPWYYFPMLIPAENNHPISRNLDPVATYFTSTIDTIKSSSVKKTILLTTTKYSKALMAPVRVHLSMLREKPDASKYNQPNLAGAVLLEGSFTSVFKNRIADTYKEATDTVKELKYLDKSKETKMIIISDGDMIRNELQKGGQGIWPLGYYSISGQTLANKTFLMNCIEYLTDEDGLIASRSKEIKVRLLDKVKVKEESTKWRVINTALPIALVFIFGIIYSSIRKRKYSK